MNQNLSSSGDPQRPRRISEFIRSWKDEILHDWELAVRRLPPAKRLEHESLVDHVPILLEAIAQMADEFALGREASLPRDVAERHALHRMSEGIDLEQVLEEYSLLRDTILAIWQRDRPTEADPTGIRALNRALDHGMRESLARYEEAREHTLEGLDRIAAAALKAKTLDELLRQFLEVLVETTATVDTASILVLEDDRLRLRASVGLGGELEPPFELALGEGFAGRIAVDRRPRSVASAATDGIVKNPLVKRTGVRALYGVPLIDGGRTIGVAQVGSLATDEFSDRDKAVISTMANRATAAIYQHLLREQADRLVEVLEFGDACLVLDRDWRVVFVNENFRLAVQSAGNHFGQEMLGRCYWDLWPDVTGPDSIIWREFHRARQEERATTFEYQYERTGRWWSANIYPTRRSGLAVFFRDTTDKKNAEEALVRAVRLREEILAVVSHDLKNPLSAIHMAASVLLRNPERMPRARGQAETIHRAAVRMDHLIGDLLDVASLQAGRLAVELRPADVESIVTEAFESSAPAAAERGIRVVYSCDLRGTEVRCDRERLLQVFGNLLGNAVKFCRPGDEISIRGELIEGDVRFVVADTGPGIPAKDLPHIFEPYWSGKLRKKGTGLGLYISRGIVESHGGRLWVESEQDRGTTFYFTVPLAPGYSTSPTP